MTIEPGRVGGEGQFVQSATQMTADPPHQVANVAPDQWLSTRQPDFRDAARDEEIGQKRNLLQAQDLIPGQELHSFGHAIAAAQITSIRHRNPQIADPAAQSVDQWCGRGSGCGHGV